MIPTLVDRLMSVARALEDVILPALPQDESLAREQASMSLQHLSLAIAQIDQYPLLEAAELQSAMQLAASLQELPQAQGTLTRVIEEAKRSGTGSPSDARQTRVRILTAIDELLQSVQPGGPSWATTLNRVIAYQRVQDQNFNSK